MKDMIFGRDIDLIASPYLFKTSKSTVGKYNSLFNFSHIHQLTADFPDRQTG